MDFVSLADCLMRLGRNEKIDIIMPNGKVKRFSNKNKAIYWASEFMFTTPAQFLPPKGFRTTIILYPYKEV